MAKRAGKKRDPAYHLRRDAREYERLERHERINPKGFQGGDHAPGEMHGQTSDEAFNPLKPGR